MDSERPQHRRDTDWQGVAFGVSLGALAAYQFFKLPPVLPLLTASYGYGRVYCGALMSVYALAGLLLSWLAGRTCSRRGPRGLIIFSLGCFIAGNTLGLMAPGQAALLIASRLLEGIGFAVLAVVGGVVTTTSASVEHRMLATGLWATWIPIGQIVGTTAAIPTVAASQWRPLWWGALALTLGIAAWGRALASSGRAALQVPVARLDTDTQGVPRQAPNRAPALPLLLVATLFALWSMQFITFMTWLPVYLVEVHGVGSAHAAAAYLVPPALIVVFNLATGVLLRAGYRLPALLGGSLAAQAAVWFLAPWTTGLATGTLALAVYGVTSGIIPTCLFALPAALPGTAISASKGFAALMTGRNLGVLVGPVLLGQVVTAWNGWQFATPLFGTICLAAMAASWLLFRTVARHPKGT